MASYDPSRPSPEEQERTRQLELAAKRVLEEIAQCSPVAGADPAAVELQLDRYIATLAEYRDDCERRAVYREADLVNHVIKHIRLEEESRQVQSMTEQQNLERQGLDEVHAIEFQNFNSTWNAKVDAFEQSQVEQETTLLERHGLELAEFAQQMSTSAQQIFRPSKHLLNLREVQKKLAAQRCYADAQRVKLQADRLYETEYRRHLDGRGGVFGRKRAALLARQQQELSALHLRMESKKIELEAARKAELELLLQRYSNVRRGLEREQNVVRSKTGLLLLNHALNDRTDTSGSSVIITSMTSGAFGPALKKKHLQSLGFSPER